MTKANPASTKPPAKYEAVQATGMSKSRVEEFVEKLRELKSNAAIPPTKEIAVFVSEIGGTLRYVPLSSPRLRPEGTDDDPNVASVLIHGPDEPSAEKFRIFVGADASYERDRFSVAHELGHVYLHSQESVSDPEPGGRISARRVMAGRPDFGASNDRWEWEANWFAAELLMPRKSVVELSERYKDSSLELAIANKFLVSRAAARVRIQDLRNRRVLPTS